MRGDLGGAKALVVAMDAAGVARDVVTFNTALAAAASAQSAAGAEWAEQLLREMAPVRSTLEGSADGSAEGFDRVRPDNRTLCAALTALGGGGRWRSAPHLLHASLHSRPSLRVFNAALDAARDVHKAIGHAIARAGHPPASMQMLLAERIALSGEGKLPKEG